MTREEIIKGLEVILEETADMFYRSTIQDALALLKVKEPVYVEERLVLDKLHIIQEYARVNQVDWMANGVMFAETVINMLRGEINQLWKAQEARLVTYDDFHSGREDGGEAIPCWKESRKKTRRSGWAVIVYGKMLADRESGVARYWTARPTEEQMREEAWPGA